jgi:uncharacterized protein (DUF305 family)
MRQWLRERGEPVPDVDVDALTDPAHALHAWHATHEASPDVVHAHGMLTHAQLDELARARGEEFDRLFLRYMIEHHRGAIAMVDALLATDGAAQDPAVFRLAADIQADQRAEIARMERMLAGMGGARGQ